MKLLRQLYGEGDFSSGQENTLPGILGDVKGTPTNQIIDANTFNGYVPQDWSPQQTAAYQASQQPAPTGALSATDYYPTLGHNINVGNYSGSEIGSTTLFAPGASVVPLGMLDARDAAIHRAALNKLKEQEDFDKRYRGYNTKHVAVQQEASEKYKEGLQQWVHNAKQKYGNDWVRGLSSDPTFNAWDKAHQDYAKYHDAIVDHAAELQMAEKDPNFVMSPELKKQHSNMLSGAYALGTGGSFNQKARNIENDFLASKALYDLDKASNETIDKAMPKIDEGTLSQLEFRGKGTQMFVDQIKKTYFPEEQREVLANNLYMEKYQGTGITKAQVRSAIDSKLNDKIEHQIKNYDTYHAPVRGGDEDYSKATPQISSTVNQTVTPESKYNQKKNEERFAKTRPIHMEEVYNTTAKDQQKELTFKINPNTIDLENNKLSDESGHVRGQVEQVGAMPYYPVEKRFLSPKEAEGLNKLGELYNNKSIDWRGVAIVNITPKTDDKGRIEKSKSVIIPIDDVKGKFGESFDKNVIDKVQQHVAKNNSYEKPEKKKAESAVTPKQYRRKTADGRIAIFDENKKFVKYE